ncbi:HNH endonuclease [Bifidobacterium platyrrhinorum]|uniref:HNH endonuclease n=1 Tax=Bifidobacterium platyrrhinorum TaxID=2661628 RepID=A0A6L9SSH1_9BIFI|nr:HNH endonuclease signature motif containing protein [Bifidobacterium platyrrhinorum]NEG55458.1 HNH endonuclease [Bifidobacterium platyrrhinorum]
MAWSNSTRKQRFNQHWERTRKLILERDHYQCQRWITDWRTGIKRKCLYPANEVDHIHRAKNGMPDDDRPENLEALCSFHHKQKTARESGEARVEKRRRREVESWYSHPAYRTPV